MEIENWIKEDIQTMKEVAHAGWFTDWDRHSQDIKKIGNDLINVPKMGFAPIIDSFVSDFVVWNWIDDGGNYAHSKAITIYCVLGIDGELYFAWQYPKADYNHQWFFTNQDMERV